MMQLLKISSIRIIILAALLGALFAAGAIRSSQASADEAGSQQGHTAAALFAGSVTAPQANSGMLVSQSQAAKQCFDRSPKPPNNYGSCRSTNPESKIYLYNNGDTSGCTFNITLDWGDGTPPQNFPNFPGGPSGWEFLASHTYSTASIYLIQATGSVVSGGCTFTGGDLQFSYILPGTPSPQGPPITAQTMLSRGADWVSNQVPYDQQALYADINGTYREDCSGFISMAWDLDQSLDTAGLPGVATEVATGLSGIEPGDIILRAKTATIHGHVFLFVGWANSKHTRATVMEETSMSSPTPYTVEKPLGVKSFSGFTVYRYDNIQ